MFQKRSMSFAIVALCLNMACAQGLMMRTFGGYANDELNAVASDALDNVYLAGYTSSFIFDGAAYCGWLTKLGRDGNTVWTKSYTPGVIGANFQAVLSVPGRIICAGGTDHPYKAFVMCLDTSGAIIWQKQIQNSGRVGAIAASHEEGYYVTSYAINNASDITVVKLDHDGNAIWSRVFDTGYADIAYGIACTPDSGAIVCGSTIGFGGMTDGLVIRYDKNGTLLWSRAYGNQYTGRFSSVISCTGGGQLVIGEWQTLASANRPVLMKIDDMGDTLWTRSLSAYVDGSAVQVEETDSGFVLLSGHWTGDGNGDFDLTFLDPMGQFLSMHRSGCPSADSPTGMARMSDGSIAIIGNTYLDQYSGAGVGADDALFAITGPDGTFSCELPPTDGTMASAPLSIIVTGASSTGVGVTDFNLTSVANHPIQTTPPCAGLNGISELECGNALMFPNPCYDLLTVVPSSTSTSILRIDLVNMLGQGIHADVSFAAPGQYQISVGSLPTGPYAVVTTTADGRRSILGTVIKQ